MSGFLDRLRKTSVEDTQKARAEAHAALLRAEAAYASDATASRWGAVVDARDHLARADVLAREAERKAEEAARERARAAHQAKLRQFEQEMVAASNFHAEAAPHAKRLREIFVELAGIETALLTQAQKCTEANSRARALAAELGIAFDEPPLPHAGTVYGVAGRSVYQACRERGISGASVARLVTPVRD